MIDRTNESIRIISGQVTSTDPLVTFLYLLMRDVVVPGRVEEIASIALKCSKSEFTNGWLANHAKNLAADFRSEQS